MQDINNSFLEIGQMDHLSLMNTPIHKIDPRAKVLTTMIFILTVVSFNKYDISALIPFFIYPIALTSSGNIPYNYILRSTIIAAPFAIMTGLFNPLIDRQVIMTLANINITGGWISFFSIIIRFILTVSSVMIMIACTGINNICLALEKFHAPAIFISQIQFLYRYLFVLAHETMRISIARKLRSFNTRYFTIKEYSNLLGHLLLRTIDRSKRIYMAMKARGFNGHFASTRPLEWAGRDIAFITFWACLFIVFRSINIPRLLGILMTGNTP